MRHLGSAVQFKNIAGSVIAADRAPRLQRHAGMAADGKLKLYDNGRRAQRDLHVTVALMDNADFRVAAGGELAWLRVGSEQDGKLLDFHGDEIGRVLRGVGIPRKHGRHRLPDVAHPLAREHGLAIRRERRDRPLAEIHRRHVGNIRGGPHCHHSRQRPCRCGVNGKDVAVRMLGAHHAHVKLVREGDVSGEAAPARDERRVLQPHHRLADPFVRHVSGALQRPARDGA